MVCVCVGGGRTWMIQVLVEDRHRRRRHRIPRADVDDFCDGIQRDGKVVRVDSPVFLKHADGVRLFVGAFHAFEHVSTHFTASTVLTRAFAAAQGFPLRGGRNGAGSWSPCFARAGSRGRARVQGAGRAGGRGGRAHQDVRARISKRRICGALLRWREQRAHEDFCGRQGTQ